jgi:exodeoxyribonuclease-1
MSYKKAVKPKTYLFHDYETFGLDPKRSKASQFASIRTDENLNIIDDDRLNIYCEITPDYLPSPEACLVTGQTPISIEEIKNKELYDGVEPKDRVVLSEDKFTLKIFRAMTKGNTCNLGYNNIDFDDEWSRNLFYRTLRNPYMREWQSGCSRADVYNIVMYAYSVDPTIINFPQALDPETNEPLFSDSGIPLPSFRLEHLSVANGIEHANAHDAFADVEATIYLLKLIKDRRPDIFNHVMDIRQKKNMVKLIANNEDKPLMHVSKFYGKTKFNSSVVQFAAYSGANPSDAIFVNLCSDLTPLLELSAEDIKEQMYMKKEELAERGLVRPPLQTVTVNKCNILSELNGIIDSKRASELNFDGAFIRANRKLFIENKQLIIDKINKIMVAKDFPQALDVDLGIYGGFFSRADEELMKDMHTANFRNELQGFSMKNASDNVKKLFFRFKARNYPDLLGVKETDLWQKFQVERVTGFHWSGDQTLTPDFAKEFGEYTLSTYLSRIENLKNEHIDEPEKMKILEDLVMYAKKILPNHF